MAEFLKLVPVEKALDLFLKSFHSLKFIPELIPIENSLGRVTSQRVISGESIPAFSRSSVDGYAVLAEDTFGSSESLPAYLKLVGEIKMGESPRFTIQSGECALIFTGGMLARGSNAVVMIENTQLSRPGEIEIQKAVSQGDNCIFIGEDVKKGDTIIPAGIILRPQEIGGLMAVGAKTIKVVNKPKVGIISSGDEIVPSEQKLPLGKIRDINTGLLTALIFAFGGHGISYGISPDDEKSLTEKVTKAFLDCDAVIVTAGSSISTRDLTARVIEKMGKPGVLVHGVNIKPGKPTILAVCNGKPLVGLPGNPVSAFVIAQLFVKPMLQQLMGMKRKTTEPVVSAVMKSNFPSLTGRLDYVPAILEKTKDGYVVEPIHFKSNLIFSLVHADGLAIISEDSNGVIAGESVNVLLI